MSKWFYRFQDARALRHREAYEKSLQSDHPIRVRGGMYYYKGYEINWGEERHKDYQWGYTLVSEWPTDWEFCRTKAECVADIEGIIEYENRKSKED